jgi:hypothetical protein
VNTFLLREALRLTGFSSSMVYMAPERGVFFFRQASNPA